MRHENKKWKTLSLKRHTQAFHKDNQAVQYENVLFFKRVVMNK